VRVKTALSEAQNGQAFANLARAFHLPPAKVEDAVDVMLDALIPDIGKHMRSRRSLAGIVALIGKSGYEQVLETPMQLGATHTQVLGTEALNVIAGRSESKRLVHRAAVVGGISEMIAEYLLPVIAAMLVGALAKLCRPELAAIMGHSDEGAPSRQDAFELPRVSGGVGFAGSTGGSASVASPAGSESYFVELAEDICRPAGASDLADAVRRVLAANLDLTIGPLGWIRRIGVWSALALNAALAGVRR
jgi:hypothetical protein